MTPTIRHYLISFVAGALLAAVGVLVNQFTLHSDKNFYPAPNLWPQPSFDRMRAMGLSANLLSILARVNLSTQTTLGARLGHNTIHVWSI